MIFEHKFCQFFCQNLVQALGGALLQKQEGILGIFEHKVCQLFSQNLVQALGGALLQKQSKKLEKTYR